ncbi:MAG: hypothetical protein KDH88_00935 [Chromatiales bacterium]|nr:hypothetical protein [Chromatiales bacterium]
MASRTFDMASGKQLEMPIGSDPAPHRETFPNRELSLILIEVQTAQPVIAIPPHHDMAEMERYFVSVR